MSQWIPPIYVDQAAFSERDIDLEADGQTVSGTLTLPVRPTGCGVVLLTGGGPHDRDETTGPNKPLKDLAWGLATRGVAVLRFDKITANRPEDPWYPINEITVYRVWTSRSVYDPDGETALEQGGVWQWRCEDHPKRAWAPYSHTAPEELQPLEEHPCDEVLPLGKSKCRRKDSTQMFVEGWFCPDHKAKYVNAANERRLLGGEDLEAGESA